MQLPQDVLNVIIGVSIIIGVIQCFLGYRIFRVILCLVGFNLGGVLIATLGYANSHQEAATLLSSLVGGCICAALMDALYSFGIFIIGAIFGGILGAVFFAAAGNTTEPSLLFILAFIAGLIALIFQKFMIIVSTGLGGAWSVVISIAYFFRLIDLTNIEGIFHSTGIKIYAILFCWLVLGIFGVIVQYKSTKAKETETQQSTAPDGEKQDEHPIACVMFTLFSTWQRTLLIAMFFLFCSFGYSH